MGSSSEAGFSSITPYRMGTCPQTCIGMVLSKEQGTNNAKSINGLLKCKQARRSREAFREKRIGYCFYHLGNLENRMNGAWEAVHELIEGESTRPVKDAMRDYTGVRLYTDLEFT